jgi:heme/copper-type cytochrome/quinol oxidase subunit 2
LTDNRIDQFKSDVADLKVKTNRGRRDSMLQILGIVLMVVGVVVAFIVYQSSTNESDSRNIESEIILAITMLALSVIGAAVFIFASLARFLRLWLLRQVYEGQENVARVLAAVREEQKTSPMP